MYMYMCIIIYLILNSTCVLDSAAESRIRCQDAVPMSCVRGAQTVMKQKIYIYIYIYIDVYVHVHNYIL